MSFNHLHKITEIGEPYADDPCTIIGTGKHYRHIHRANSGAFCLLHPRLDDKATITPFHLADDPITGYISATIHTVASLPGDDQPNSIAHFLRCFTLTDRTFTTLIG